MGGQVGTEFDVSITGEYIEETTELMFSSDHLKATPKLDADGNPIENQFVVNVSEDCPVGVYEAFAMTRLGVSSARAFSVGRFPEQNQSAASTTLESAVSMKVNSVCNAVMPTRAVNHYAFEAKAGQRILVDCAARRIDSELNPVLILGDALGRDLRVQRRGGAIDFTVPSDGKYTVKVHDLTFNGGANYFYRLCVRELTTDEPVNRMLGTQIVSAHSWPPAGLSGQAALKETPESKGPGANKPQTIELPCDIAGSFYPAADVDRFQFHAKKGEVWWVEIGSQRLGRPTDPAAVVQRVATKDGVESLVDVLELNDVPSPVKTSSYGYSYDGPPYDAGTSDFLGKLEIKEDGLYRIQITDLLGSTRNDPANRYRLVIRKASPDFAVVMWGLHMTLRNGDRNALSKPISLRGGATMAMEVIAIRRDGFEGEIDLALENLPDGVTATGLKIGAKQSRGMLLVTAAEGAPRGFAMAQFVGKAMIDGKEVVREGRMASMAFPIKSARDQVTSPRLIGCIPVSIGGAEVAPMSIAARDEKVFEAKEGEKLTIPLIHMKRGKFSGKNLNASTMGFGFERNKKFDIPLDADASEAVLDLKALKVKPGDYKIAFYGGAVAKHSHYPAGVDLAKAAQQSVTQRAKSAASEVTRLTAEFKTASAESRANIQKQLDLANSEKKAADAAVKAAAKKVASATKAARQTDIADIIVSKPISIRVLPADKK